MDNQTIRSLAQAQLALDLGCEPDLFNASGNQVILWRDCAGRRKYNDNRPVLEIAVCNNKLIAACDAEIIEPCRALLEEIQGEWLFSPRYLRRLEEILRPIGYEVGPLRHFYLPRLPLSPAEPMTAVRWYEGDELEYFRDNPQWADAVVFDAYAPDFLCVAALDDGGSPIGLAACILV